LSDLAVSMLLTELSLKNVAYDVNCTAVHAVDYAVACVVNYDVGSADAPGVLLLPPRLISAFVIINIIVLPDVIVPICLDCNAANKTSPMFCDVC